MKKIAVILVCVIALAGFTNAQTKTAVKTTDLQKAITDNITKDYSGYNILTSYKMEKGTNITYEIEVAKGADKLVLVYDNDGKFLSKHPVHMAQKVEHKQNSNNQATAKKPEAQKTK